MWLGSFPCADLLRVQTQDTVTAAAFCGVPTAGGAVWEQLSEMDSGLLAVRHVSFGTRTGSSSDTS